MKKVIKVINKSKIDANNKIKFIIATHGTHKKELSKKMQREIIKLNDFKAECMSAIAKLNKK